MKHYTPFTADKRPPAFLPKTSRLTWLLMEKAHSRKHSGIEESVAQFRLMGFWTTEAAKMAKVIKNRCITCRYLDIRPIEQQMGAIPKQQLVSPMA